MPVFVCMCEGGLVEDNRVLFLRGKVCQTAVLQFLEKTTTAPFAGQVQLIAIA